MCDFKIVKDEHGRLVLDKYLGSGGDVIIPKDVYMIGHWSFASCLTLTSVMIPDNVEWIGWGAFAQCTNLKSVTILGKDVLLDEDMFESCDSLSGVFAPYMSLEESKPFGYVSLFVSAFVSRWREYSDPVIVKEYVDYISFQRKKMLPIVYKQDAANVLQMLIAAKKITKKNLEKDYLLPAIQCRAVKCTALLETLYENYFEQKYHANISSCNTLWDGEHFSFDGKKLLKCPENPGQTVYEVPEGTIEICKNAFDEPSFAAIFLPESITNIRNGAFYTKKDHPLFIRLPKTLKTLPEEAFHGGSRECYYISSPVKELAGQLCMNSYSLGHRRMIYTGGPLDDLPSQLKKHAVEGFLFAEQYAFEDMSKWRDSYLTYIKRNVKTYIKKVKENAFLFNLLLDEKLLSHNGAKEMLEYVSAMKRPDYVAAVLDYQEKNFGKEEQPDLFELKDNDPELKRMSSMLARREEIKGQKGIAGLAFVVTGDLKNFGYTDYYGAKDLSDLKRFIEARGGFLRSAISSKTDYLICNDPQSKTVKSQKAKELDVPVITEQEFLKMAEDSAEV